MRHVIRTASCFAFGLIAVAFGFCSQAEAQAFRTLDEGPVHEAFVPPVAELTPLEPIPHAPPPLVRETIPRRVGADTVWISGYWAWLDDRQDFAWVSGSWRRPPAGRYWVKGMWLELDEGFVWVRGFWSPAPEAELIYIDEPPPELEDEDVPPAPGEGYFWLGGHWAWSPERRAYVQYSGHWEPMIASQVLVPAHFVWRPGGYVYVSAYWDWVIENRGCTYAPIYIEPAARIDVIYEPTVICEPEFVFGWCMSYYPDYVYLLHHHHHHHGAWWHAHYDVPPWWGWSSWWSLSWHDHWGVWWWYTHPGYPHPHWMSVTLAARIHAPSEKILKFGKKAKAPAVITSVGAIRPGEALAVSGKGKAKGDGGGKGKGGPIVAKKGSIGEKVAAKGGKTPATTIVPTGVKGATGSVAGAAIDVPARPKGKSKGEAGKSVGKGSVGIPKFGETPKGDSRERGGGKSASEADVGRPKSRSPEPPIAVEPKSKGRDKPKEETRPPRDDKPKEKDKERGKKGKGKD
jgi:hypothetical protein